jgi:uncharacterized protein (DUF1330 family)
MIESRLVLTLDQPGTTPAGYCAIAWACAEGRMPAYMIAEHTITDPVKFEEYRTKVGPIIAKHGGRYITKPGSHVILEKENAVWQPERVVIIEFPDMAALNAWYRSPEYQPLIKLRHTAAKDMLITLEGG